MKHIKKFEQTQYIDGNTEFIYKNGIPLKNGDFEKVCEIVDKNWIENNYDLFIHDGQYYAMNNDLKLPIYEEADNLEELISFLYVVQNLQNEKLEIDDVFRKHFNNLLIDDNFSVYVQEKLKKRK